MSPSETRREPGLLEHPAEAFAYYRAEGIGRVVGEEKHMVSRAVVVCRDSAVVRRQFGLASDEVAGGGMVYSRTGRRFFEDGRLAAALLERLRSALDASGLWDEVRSDWMVLDAELLPRSAKARHWCASSTRLLAPRRRGLASGD